MCSRPNRSWVTRPTSSRTRRCCDTAGRVIGSGAARSRTALLPDASATTICRRTGWATAPKTSVTAGAPALPIPPILRKLNLTRQLGFAFGSVGVGVAGVVGPDDGPFASAVDEGPAVAGFEVVVKG